MPYLAPTSAADALSALAAGGLRVVAGCTDVYPSLRPGDTLDAVLDVSGVSEWRGIKETSDGWRIGAATTWTEIVRAPLPPAFDALKQAAREVGSIQIQNSATLGGNLCNASPAADGVPPLLALEAEVEIASAPEASTRRVPLADFITGVRQVDLAPGELLAAIHIPRDATGGGSAFEKLGARKHLVISIAMVAAVIDCSTSGRIAKARVAVGSCSPVARRLPALETRLIGLSPDDLSDATLEDPVLYAPLAPISDVRGTDAYRRDAVPELCRRAVRAACVED
ncbi:MAG: FAD binding domain-containing protein [Pseudomonadota bacterium]